VAEPTRERIVRVAMELFRDKGYQSTSIADLLASAKVNSGSLYHFFPSKQDVLLAVLDTYHAGIDHMLLKPAWRNERDPIEKIFALLAAYRRMLVETDCFYGCPIGSLALELHEPDPPVRARLAANFDAWVAAVERCFVDAGPRLPATVDRRALAVFALTTMEGGVMLARTHRTPDAFDSAVRMLRDHVARLEAAAAVSPDR
jgi:TetR/AcrR family transcriptional regulator, transcriptional repressor for nem operon